jgi:hypothetical protein
MWHDSWEILLNSPLFHPPNFHKADVRSDNAPGRWIVGQTVCTDQADVRSGINFHRAGGCSVNAHWPGGLSVNVNWPGGHSINVHWASGCSVRHFAPRKRMFVQTFCT